MSDAAVVLVSLWFVLAVHCIVCVTASYYIFIEAESCSRFKTAALTAKSVLTKTNLAFLVILIHLTVRFPKENIKIF